MALENGWRSLTLRLEGTRSVSLTAQQSGRDAELMRVRWDPDLDREVFGLVRDLSGVLCPFGAFRFAPGGPPVVVMRYWGFECTNYAVRTLTATQVVVNQPRAFLAHCGR